MFKTVVLISFWRLIVATKTYRVFNNAPMATLIFSEPFFVEHSRSSLHLLHFHYTVIMALFHKYPLFRFRARLRVREVTVTVTGRQSSASYIPMYNLMSCHFIVRPASRQGSRTRGHSGQRRQRDAAAVTSRRDTSQSCCCRRVYWEQVGSYRKHVSSEPARLSRIVHDISLGVYFTFKATFSPPPPPPFGHVGLIFQKLNV